MPADPERANFDRLYAAVFDDLARGFYGPGERIGLKALSSRLGVSVTPLREVLSRLVGRDLVAERRREGYYLVRLDGRDLADLYRLHQACIERAIAKPLAFDGDGHSLPQDIWGLFEALVAASGDRILAGVQRYLDDRLRLVRRCERMLLGDEEQAMLRLRSAIMRNDTDAMGAETAAFHLARARVAGAIADLVSRRRPL